MTLRQEIQSYIDAMPEEKLLALKPLLFELVNDTVIIDADLTDEEYVIIEKGIAAYRKNPDSYTPLSDVL